MRAYDWTLIFYKNLEGGQIGFTATSNNILKIAFFNANPIFLSTASMKQKD